MAEKMPRKKKSEVRVAEEGVRVKKQYRIVSQVNLARTGLRFIDELWGGIPFRTPVAIFGPTRAGKTLLVLQLGFYLASRTGTNILAIRSEASFDTIAREWYPRLIERYSPDYIPDLFIESAVDMVQLLRLHGEEVAITLRKASGKSPGRLEFEIIGTTEDKVAKYVREQNVGVIIYDSLTAPIHRSFPARRENFPARADAIKRLAYHMLRVCDMAPVFILTTHHQSMDPANPYAKPSMASEGTLGYEFGYIMYVEKYHDGAPTIRRIWSIRAPGLPEWGAHKYAVIDKLGYWDVENEETAKKLKAGSLVWDENEHRPVSKRSRR